MKENAFWRNYHRIFPPLLISLEYPLWNRKDISGSYLNVEATPIIKLLMGKAFYGSQDFTQIDYSSLKG